MQFRNQGRQMNYFLVRASKSKLGARVGKSKLGARAGARARAGDQAKGRGLRNTKTQQFFVQHVQKVSIKIIFNKEKQMCSY